MKATNILNVLCVVFVLALSGCTSKAVRVCPGYGAKPVYVEGAHIGPVLSRSIFI